MPLSIPTIRRRYEKGTLEVEHLLDITKSPDPAIGESLLALSAELAWPFVDEARRRSTARTAVIPWGGWADVVAAYCRGGFPPWRPGFRMETTAPWSWPFAKR